ncbi:hypothetical protein Tco_0432856 [Tanacetum coccineum]
MEQEMAEAGFGAYWDGSDRLIPDNGDLRDYWMEISFDKDFLGPAPYYVLIQDPVRRLCHMMIAYSISGRGQPPEKACEGEEEWGQAVRGHFIGRLAMHFRLVSNEGLRGLQAWVAQGPERKQAGAHKAGEAGQVAEEVAQEIPAPAQVPPPPLPAPQPRTMSQMIKRIEEEVHDLQRDVVGLQGVIESFTIE